MELNIEPKVTPLERDRSSETHANIIAKCGTMKPLMSELMEWRISKYTCKCLAYRHNVAGKKKKSQKQDINLHYIGLQECQSSLKTVVQYFSQICIPCLSQENVETLSD